MLGGVEITAESLDDTVLALTLYHTRVDRWKLTSLHGRASTLADANEGRGKKGAIIVNRRNVVARSKIREAKQNVSTVGGNGKSDGVKRLKRGKAEETSRRFQVRTELPRKL